MKAEDFGTYETPMKTVISNEKHWSDHVIEWEKSKIVHDKAVASTKTDKETAKALKDEPAKEAAPKVEEAKKAEAPPAKKEAVAPAKADGPK